MASLGDVIGGLLASRAAGGQHGALSSVLMGLLASRTGGTGAMMGGLEGLLQRFTAGGHGDKVESWISHGQNRALSPRDVEDAFSPDEVKALSRQSGMPRGDLLQELSHLLPGLVDRLTPQGRLPTCDETARW